MLLPSRPFLLGEEVADEVEEDLDEEIHSHDVHGVLPVEISHGAGGAAARREVWRGYYSSICTRVYVWVRIMMTLYRIWNIYIWICRVCIQGNLNIILSTYYISLYKNCGLRGFAS